MRNAKQQQWLNEHPDAPYESRCVTTLKKWGAPVVGWYCVGVEDYTESSGDPEELTTCELCERAPVRYVHIMEHDQYFEEMRVGCICAGRMEGNDLAARRREIDMRNRAKRKANYLKRVWKPGQRGSLTLRYRKHDLAIITIGTSNKFWLVCDGQIRGGGYDSQLGAIHGAFDQLDPVVVGRCARK